MRQVEDPGDGTPVRTDAVQRIVVQADDYWWEIAKNPPPAGCKIFLLTRAQTAVIGHYYSEGDFVGWRPLFKIPPELKAGNQ